MDVLVLTLTAAVSVFTQTGDPNYDLRKVSWGMTQQQVIEVEGKPLSNLKESLLYATTITGLKTALSFRFVDGKLAKVNFVLTEQYAEPNQYFIAAAKWVSAMKEKYGEPRAESEWINELYRKDSTRWGMAVAAGHLRVINRWENERSRISCMLYGQNFKSFVMVTFESKELAGALEAEAKKKARDEF